MRQFLMKCIIPVLTEGMIDVWRVGPTDPVDYLADYVFKKSNEIGKWETKIRRASQNIIEIKRASVWGNININK